jgi:hypothetical protein
MYTKKRKHNRRRSRRDRFQRLYKKLYGGNNATNIKKLPMNLIYFNEKQPTECLELEWLQEIFNRKFIWKHYTEKNEPGSKAIVYYQHPVTPSSDIESWINDNKDVKIYLLQVSDEETNSDIDFYNNPLILAVFRNYWRPECITDKVMHIPLGYTAGKGSIKNITLSSKRPVLWSFAGALDRGDRNETIKLLKKKYTNNDVHLTPEWGSSENLKSDKYLKILSNSIFVPCLDGASNTETYRFYETLEAGALPIIRIDEKKSYENLLPGAPLLTVNNWNDDISFNWDECQKNLRAWWINYKKELNTQITDRLSAK